MPEENCSRCLHLKTKMDYVAHEPDENDERAEDETFGGTAHRWYCLHTMTVMGPDDDLVGPRLCGTARDCYESSGF
jgi:hypothetical protein